MVALAHGVASLIYHCTVILLIKPTFGALEWVPGTHDFQNVAVCGAHESSRESIVDVGAQIPNALYDGSIGLLTQI